MRKYVTFVAVLVAVLAADQATKVWARAVLKPATGEKTVIPGFWEFIYSENTGSAFGLFRAVPGSRYIFIVVGIAALIFIAGYMRRPESDRMTVCIPLALIAGGAIGNIFDRLAFGRVTDFILWHYKDHRWPAFNVADAALVAGVLALILFGPKKPAEQKVKAEQG
jgi:signal peptidase II